jgi:parallel beta-helix repeat protein
MKTFYICVNFAILLLLQIQNNIAQTVPLNGTYSVGSGGNYATLDTAIKSLSINGINGPVIFNIKNGAYNEQISIPQIAGSSATNTITFQSETGDSSLAKIFFTGNWENNHVIRLNGADNIIFRKLTIEISGDYYSRAIVIDSSSNNIRIESNIIRNPFFSTDCGEGCSQNNALIYAYSDFYNNNITITNNLFENGIYGIRSSNSKQLKISKNIFKNQIYASLYVNYQDSLFIDNNTFNTQSNEYNFRAIYISDCNVLSILKNKIAANSGNGIILNSCNGNVSNYGFIANNFISSKGNSEENTLSLNYCSYLNILYNSIHIHSGNTMWTCAAKVQYGNNIKLLNNIFSNSTSGYALYISDTTSIETSDYNNFYTSGNKLIFWSKNYSTLADFQGESSKDEHSVSNNPFFVSNSDLHTFSSDLNGKASPTVLTDKDIDGEPRNVNFPDIGADEFTPPPLDAGISSLIDASKPFARGERNISVLIKNFGTTTLSSANINWTLNGVAQTSNNWSGTLATGQTALINLGNFVLDKNVDYIVKCWTTIPNGITDNINYNDTITAVLHPSISGTYTIGGTNPDFISFQEAATALVNKSIVGNVVFKVRNGTYNEQIDLNGITGTSKNATITFESESGDSSLVTLSWSSSYDFYNHTLRLNGADYIIINKITIEALNPQYGRAVDLRNGANYNTFKNCVIKGVTYWSAGENQSLVYSDSNNDEYNNFINNRFEKGSFGIFLQGSYSVAEKGNRIENNTFENQDNNAINFSNQDSIIIQNNNITANSNSSSFYGIRGYSCSNAMEITKNKVSISGWGNGIYLGNCNTNGNVHPLIANNFITVTYNGIELYYSDNVNIYNNSVNITGTSSGRALQIESNSNSTGSINIVNNIFANFTNGGFCFNYSTGAPISVFDYNNFFTTSQYLGIISAYITDLNDLKTKTGKNAHSISINPKFNSETDLHVSEIALNNAGTPLPEVNKDIDNESRNPLSPDIGADEFSPTSKNDAGIFAIENLKMPFTSGTRNLLVSIKNFGGDTLKSVAIDWIINGVQLPRYDWTGSLKSGDTAIVNIGNYNFGIKTNYTVTTWTTLPNGVADTENTNDTMRLSSLFSALNGTYTIGGTTPDFISFSEAASTLKQGGINGAVIFKVRPGTYNEQVAIQKIKGTSAANTLLFESEDGDSTSVVLNFSANAANNYTLLIDSAGTTTINKLYIKSLDVSYGNVIKIGNYNTSVNITNCVLENASYSSITIESVTRTNFCKVINNRILNGAYGLYFPNGITDLRIINNSFKDQRNYGIYVYNPDTLIIRKNIIDAYSGSSNFSAVSISSYCRQIKIEKNRINIPEGGTGISFNNINGISKENTLVANNFIHIGGTSFANGISCSTSYNLNIINNSVNITNKNPNSRAFNIFDYYNTNIELQNNILANLGGGYAYYSYNKNLVTVSDYNNLFTTGSNLAYWDGNRTSLADLQLTSSKDIHSVSSDPLFVSDTDLHVKDATLNGKGISLPGITDDIDEEPRDKQKPDIGADEFSLLFANDAGITSLQNLTFPITSGLNDVKIILKNYGNDTLKSVAIDWKVNNIAQTRYAWSGNLPSGETTILNIGTFNFNIKEKYTFVINTLLPNGQNDYVNYNDTITLTDLVSGLGGTYTIGGKDPDFTNFTHAVNTLISGGVTNNVIFKIRPGTYNEQVTINKITGSSVLKTITFESENGDSTSVIMSFNATGADNYILSLNGISDISFNKLTIQSVNNQFADVIQLNSINKRINFTHCIIKSESKTAAMLFYSGSGSIDSSNISNNLFLNGSFGIYVSGISETRIEKNSFTNQSDYGILLYSNRKTSISKNIFNNNPLSTSYTAINLYNSGGSHRIEKNRINITSDGIGIKLFNGGGNYLEPAIVSNNFIHVGGGSTSYGISANATNIEVCYNSVFLSNNNANSSALLIENTSSNNFRNNSLANFGGGYAIYYYIVPNTSDYNNLYSTGAYLASLNGNNYNLTDLRNVANREIHSVSVNPKYISVSDLHVKEENLNNAGTPITLVNDDIDGDPRDASFPDIGADEFDNKKHDIGILAVAPTSGCLLGSNIPVSVTVKNYGSYPESNFQVKYIFENSDSASITVAQTLQAGESVIINFNKNINLSVLKSYKLKAYTFSSLDENRLNDTVVNEIANMPKLQLKITNDTSICLYSGITLSATGATSYKWSNGYTTGSFYINPAQKNTYKVIAKNQFNCETTDSVTVNILPLPIAPVINPSGTINICNDSVVILTSSYSSNNIWSTEEKTTSIKVKKTGAYSVSYIDSLGCASTSNATYVNKEPAPELEPTDTTVCSASTMTLRVSGGTIFKWSTGQTTRNIIANPATSSTYTVTVTTALGCSKILTGKINVIPAQTPTTVSGMLPSNGADGVALPMELSWMPSGNTTLYDVYVWPLNETKPSKPFASNVTGIRSNFNTDNLGYGKTYNWQVVSKYYGCASIEGPVQSFTVRQLPDLIVTNVQAPKSTFTGQEIEVTWNVKNQGLGSTINQPWRDHITLSIDSTMEDDFYTLGNESNMTYLEPGQSYSRKAKFKLPDYKDGLFTVFARTNYWTPILETDNNNNVLGSLKPTMVSLAPVPDLYVSDIYAPTDFFSEDTVTVSWKVINKGKWHTSGLSWSDRIYLAKDFDDPGKKNIGDFYYKGDTLKPGQAYTATMRVAIPQAIYGKYFFFVETDNSGRIYEHAYDGNNVSQSDTANIILRPPADLEISNIIVPKSTTNIGVANMKWKVTNMGNSSPLDKNWSENVYLSKMPVFNPNGNTIRLFQARRSANPNGIPTGMQYMADENIEIPNNIDPGDYYVYVFTDANNDVFEYNFENNNIARSDTTMKITIAPYPDLTVTGINVPDSAGAGEEITVNYMVANKGTAIARNGWSDMIFFDDLSSSGNYIKEVKRYDILGIEASYIVSISINLPKGITYGNGKHHIGVKTNYTSKLYEHSQEQNNTKADSIFIIPSNLSVTDVAVPENTYTGTSATISYNVKNLANVSTPSLRWADKIEILDSTFKLTLIRSQFNLISGSVLPGISYNGGASLDIPEGLETGTYYTKVSVDSYNENGERITSNNQKLVPIKITKRKPTDLIIQSLTALSEGTSGQPIDISYSVANKGAGNTLSKNWNDLFVLSKDTIIDKFDILLSVSNHLDGLTSGESYNNNIRAFIPIATIGNYYLISKTDGGNLENANSFNSEFEMNAENNNTQIRLISIKQAPPSDLIVTQITQPDSAITGNQLTIGWTIKNSGPNKATGYLTDMVYFSKDTIWDISDPYFGEKAFKINLDVNKDTTLSITTELTSAAVGKYYVIVRADNKNNIFETNDYNNTLSSSSQVAVETPVLKLNITESAVLKNSKGLFYRIEIPDSLVDETLLVTLKGDTISGSNELFISYDKLPNRSDYEFNSRVASYGNQEVIVPELKKGNYYLLIYGNVSVGQEQNVAIRAEKINFQIRTADASKGGNLGTLTTLLYGAKFSPQMKVMLRSTNYLITGEKLIYIDPTRVFVTFNLFKSPLGTYDILAIGTKGDTAILKKGFEVEEGTPLGLVTSVKSPGAMRIGTKTTVAVQFANEGNNDIPIPKFKLISLNKLPVALMKKDLEKNQTTVEFELHEVNGPQHIIRPGAVNSLYIWVWATSGGLTEFKFE